MRDIERIAFLLELRAWWNQHVVTYRLARNRITWLYPGKVSPLHGALNNDLAGAGCERSADKRFFFRFIAGVFEHMQELELLLHRSAFWRAGNIGSR